jgi:streptomycin 3"-adenylyltransferase
MKGTDKDLAAHFTIINYRGKVLYGQEIKEVFGEVSKQDFFDSIWSDIEGAQEDILDNTAHITLNLENTVLRKIKVNLSTRNKPLICVCGNISRVFFR